MLVYNLFGNFCGRYEDESKTYFEERETNQVLWKIPAICFSFEVLKTIEHYGCKIVCVTVKTKKAVNPVYWLKLADLKRVGYNLKTTGKFGTQFAVPISTWKTTPIYIDENTGEIE